MWTCLGLGYAKIKGYIDNLYMKEKKIANGKECEFYIYEKYPGAEKLFDQI